MANDHTAAREQWALYREDANERGEAILTLPKAKRWYPYFGAAGPRQENVELLQVFGRALTGGNTSQRLNDLAGTTNWHGALVPGAALDRLGIHRLRNAAEVLEFRRNHFDFYGYLRQTLASALANPGQPRALAGLWNYVLSYGRLLNRARSQGAEVGTFKQGLGDAVRFDQMLPSEQCITLLLGTALRHFPQHWDGAEHRRLVAAAHPPVRAFFESVGDLDDLFSGRSVADDEAAFYICCAADLPFVVAQDMLDNRSGRDLIKRLSGGLAGRLQDGSEPGLKERLQRFAGRFGLLDRAFSSPNLAPIGYAQGPPAAAPAYGIPRRTLAEPDARKWYELHPEELTALLNEINGRPEWLEQVNDRWEDFLAGTLEALTAPVLVWPKLDDHYVPQWAAADPKLLGSAVREHEATQEKLKKDLNRITRLLPKLLKATSLPAIRAVERKRSPFLTEQGTARWRQAVDRQRQTVLSRRRFREQKKEQFGFADARFTAADEHLWLDEMLKVEEEVRPYMAYVRRAFQAALPVGSTIEFNPFRHRHDGVEFDPETIQDQDKWLRGDVMKTLRSRRNYAPITQVNVFCLDFSRSMNHDLMRNLFKVVFLLVTGLEGRETYDAIHFFGSKFIPAVAFTDSKGYTSRAVLAKILSQVASIEQNSVIYSGFGGTNISDAVEQSHVRINDFSKRLAEEEPELRFVKSILILTDGQPTVGVISLSKLKEFIEGFRDGGDTSIKGIYLKHPDDRSDFMRQIFGPLHSVEASSFEELIASFVQTMSLTYRKQRKEYRTAEKRKKLLGVKD